MNPLTPRVALWLTLPPLLWAGNAVVGRLMAGQVPPMTLNLLRWVLAFVILLPLTHALLRRDSALWPSWRRFTVLGLLGVGCYNALQYLALKTSTPINVTLVASSTPLWMLLVGRLFFGAAVTRMQLVGGALSMAGVLVVLSRGHLETLAQVRLVPGDLYVLLAALAWAFYSWLLARRDEPASIRSDWAAFVMAQVVFGLGWSSLFAGAEWVWLLGHEPQAAHISWSPAVLLALAYIAIGPAVLAYRYWGLGVAQAGPTLAGFFSNLTPLFAAVMSALVLGEAPRLYYALAFGLIVAGIAVSARR